MARCKTRHAFIKCPNCLKETPVTVAFDEHNMPISQASSYYDSALPVTVVRCVFCCFSAEILDFVLPENITQEIKDFLVKEKREIEEFERISGHFIQDSYSFYIAARIAQYKHEPVKAFQYYLNAARCCIQEQNYERESYYRKFAARILEDLVSSKMIASNERGLYCLVIAMQYSRIGDSNNSVRWRCEARRRLEATCSDFLTFDEVWSGNPLHIPDENVILTQLLP